MKSVIVTSVALMLALGSCVSTSETSPVVAAEPTPVVAPTQETTGFVVGDVVTINFPGGEKLDGEIVEIGEVAEFVMDETGRRETCRAIVVVVTREVQAPDGSTTELRIAITCPEAALTGR